jgi:hypothetical protein
VLPVVARLNEGAPNLHVMPTGLVGLLGLAGLAGSVIRLMSEHMGCDGRVWGVFGNY